MRLASSRPGPINSSRFGTAASRAKASSGVSSAGIGKEAGDLFNFKEMAKTQNPTPQAPISTQGVNRRNQPAAKPAANTSTTASSASAAPQPGTTANTLKPKSIDQLADTDWFLVTSVSDTKYYYNRKTKETALQLPASVMEYLARTKTAIKSATSVPLNPSSSAHTASKASNIAPKSASQAATTSQPSSTSKSATFSHTAAASSSATTSNKVQEADHFPPIAPAKVPAAHYTRAVDSMQKSLGVDGRSEVKIPENFVFTAEEKASRRKALQEEYEKQTGNTDVFEISEEELEDLMHDELAMFMEDDTDGIEVPEYISPIIKRSKGEDASAAKTSPALKALKDLASTNLLLYENADRMIARGETQKLVDLANGSVTRLQEKVSNGLPLTLREQSVYLNGQLMLARAYNKLRKWSEAAKALERAREIDSSHSSTMIIDALNQIHQNQLASAMRVLNSILENDPENVLVLRLLADAYCEIGELATAEQVIDDALSINKKSYESIIIKSNIVGLQGDMESAATLIDRAIKVDSSRPEAFVQEAKLFFGVDNKDKGMEAVKQALDCDNNYGPAYALLGKIFLGDGMYDDAQKCFNAALETDPYMVEALLGLASLHFEKNDWASMLDRATLAVQVDNGALDGWMMKGRAELELKNWASAVSSFERTIALDRRAEEAYLYLGTALHGAGRTKECIARMDQLLAINPDSAKARVNKGFALQTQGKPELALSTFEEAIAIDPKDEDAKMGKVSALFSLGRKDEANEFFMTFKNPENQSIFESAKVMASQTQAAHQKRLQDEENAASTPMASDDLPASAEHREAEFQEQSRDVSEAELDAELARVSGMTDLPFTPSPEELGNISPEELAKVLQNNEKMPDNFSPESMMKDLQGELSRVNEMLEKIGMPKMSLDAEEDLIHSNMDVSQLDPENMQAYADLLSRYQQEVQEQEAKGSVDDRVQFAQSLGIDRTILEQITKFEEEDPEAAKKFAQEVESRNYEMSEDDHINMINSEMKKDFDKLGDKAWVNKTLKQSISRIKSKKAPKKTL